MSSPTKSKVQYKKIQDSVFNRDIHFVVGPHDEARAFIENTLGVVETPDSDSDGESSMTADGVFILWIEQHDGTSHWDGILAHEILHTTSHVLQYVGVKFCEESEEVYAHYMGSLMKRCKQFLRLSK